MTRKLQNIWDNCFQILDNRRRETKEGRGGLTLPGPSMWTCCPDPARGWSPNRPRKSQQAEDTKTGILLSQLEPGEEGVALKKGPWNTRIKVFLNFCSNIKLHLHRTRCQKAWLRTIYWGIVVWMEIPQCWETQQFHPPSITSLRILAIQRP